MVGTAVLAKRVEVCLKAWAASLKKSLLERIGRGETRIAALDKHALSPLAVLLSTAQRSAHRKDSRSRLFLRIGLNLNFSVADRPSLA